jgi:hypothetical protein
MINPKTLDISKLPWLPIHVCEAFPKSPAIYLAIDDNDRILYIGRSNDPCRRFNAHEKIDKFLESGVSKVAFLFIGESIILPEIESILILHFRPKLNRAVPQQGYCTSHMKTYFKPVAMDKRLIKACSEGLKIRKVTIGEIIVKGFGEAIHQAQQQSRRPVSMIVIELGISTSLWHSIIYERVESISFDLLKKIEEILKWNSGVSISGDINGNP